MEGSADPWHVERVREMEALRAVLRAELRHTPQRKLAELVGISRSALRKFLAMSEPGEATLERIRQWCEDRPEPRLPPGVVALAVLVSRLPAPERLRARRQIAARLAEQYAEAGMAVPEWVEGERGGG